MELIIVRRGDTDRFHFLQEIYRSQPSVRVMWDRRVNDRRQWSTPAVPERRQSERRSTPPRSWTTMGFVFVELPDEASQRQRPKREPAALAYPVLK